jgi:hypothetical protein
MLSGINLDKYLILKDTYNNNNIYTINKKYINDIFLIYNINIDNFILSSDLITYNNNITKILFFNKKICIKPIDYKIINQFNKGYLWKPINPDKNYKSIGLLYSIEKPSINSIYLISNIFLSKIKYTNEYNNLSNNIHGFYSINKNAIDYNYDFKLKNIQGEKVILKHNPTPWYINDKLKINLDNTIINNNNINLEEFNYKHNNNDIKYLILVSLLILIIFYIIYKKEHILL